MHDPPQKGLLAGLINLSALSHFSFPISPSSLPLELVFGPLPSFSLSHPKSLFDPFQMAADFLTHHLGGKPSHHVPPRFSPFLSSFLLMAEGILKEGY
jgi:hypothetical protein